MIRKQKEKSIELVKDILSENEMIVLLDYKGLDAGGVSSLRMKLKGKKANLKVFKNTLVKRAVKDTDLSFLEKFLFEQMAIPYSKDPISLANIINSFIKENGTKIKLKGVVLNGKNEDLLLVERMAGLGSMEDIRARFIGVLQASGSQLVGVLEAYAKKN
jgi:large subunit ribosomal protein L10